MAPCTSTAELHEHQESGAAERLKRGVMLLFETPVCTLAFFATVCRWWMFCMQNTRVISKVSFRGVISSNSALSFEHGQLRTTPHVMSKAERLISGIERCQVL